MSRLRLRAKTREYAYAKSRRATGPPGRSERLGGLGGHFAALADVPASFARESARLRIREIEERDGFPAALRTLGGFGGHRGAPMWKEWAVACSRLTR